MLRSGPDRELFAQCRSLFSVTCTNPATGEAGRSQILASVRWYQPEGEVLAGTDFPCMSVTPAHDVVAADSILRLAALQPYPEPENYPEQQVVVYNHFV